MAASIDEQTTAIAKPPVNILLVDDQPAKLLSYEVILAELGENLIRANSGKEALAHLLKTDIAVVLVDVCMPELDGFELATMIRHHPRLQKTAIILVSGVLVEDIDRLKGYHAGAVDYVSVPIAPEILRAKVSTFAELYRKTEELQRLNHELEQRVSDRTAEIEALLARAEDARREAETANRLKDEFLATLSHELRTPLSAITGWVHILKTGKLDQATYVKAIETISRNAQLQTRLISDILDVSSIITGKLRLNLEPVDLPAVIEAALDTLRPAAEARGIHLKANLAHGSEPVLGDPARLQQVVWNLVSNAIKFAPQDGYVDIALAVADEQVEITVQDNGSGIAPEFLPYIFDRFRQADSSSTRTHQGLGLGLAIVRHLMEMHGGSVQAMNRSDRSGAIFRLSLPRHAVAEATNHAEQSLPCAIGSSVWQESAPSLAGIRVLIVDDAADAREVVTEVLKLCGAEVCAAASAREALWLLERDRPDVLLADIEMPGEDGYSLLRKLRALPPERGGQTPAAALTAYASAQDRANVLNAGFQEHVPKPVQPAELAAVVITLATTHAVSQA
jgi:signal transduction histidine kinase